MQPGVSTLALNDEAERWTQAHGAKSAPLGYKGFPKSICTSINEVVCHGIPHAKQILKDGDIINIDVTLIVDGYHGDTSRMFSLGNPARSLRNWWQSLTSAAAEALRRSNREPDWATLARRFRNTRSRKDSPSYRILSGTESVMCSTQLPKWPTTASEEPGRNCARHGVHDRTHDQ